MTAILNTDRIAKDLRREEGYRRFSYLDHLGYTTVGVGRCVHEGVGYGIDEEEAMYLLTRDIERCAVECERSLPCWSSLSGNVREAIIQLVFQMGLPNYLKFKKHLAALEAGDFELAAIELLDSKFAKQTPSRAERMAERIRSG